MLQLGAEKQQTVLALAVNVITARVNSICKNYHQLQSNIINIDYIIILLADNNIIIHEQAYCTHGFGYFLRIV